MKKLVSLILSLILSFATFTLVACDGNGVQPHEHSYGETYIFDKVNHWKECECKEKTEVSTHVDSDSNYKCDVCNYEMERISHSHEFNSNYVTDENNHWKECDCGEKSELGSHVDGDNNGKCDTCSYEVKKEEIHTHDFGSNYLTDATNHWKECDCGEKSELGSHIDGDNNGKCDTCSYQMKKEEVHTHNFGSQYLSDENNHWKKCSCGETSLLGAHSDANNDGKCDTCSYQMKKEEVHTHNFGSQYLSDENNHWKECDCGEKSELGSHVDGDNNGKCDTCSYQMHTHNYGSQYLSDENNHWKKCSCGQTASVGAHADANNDGKCDTCSYQMAVIPEVQGPQTPVIPNHPTSGDSSYLGKTAIELYTKAMENAIASGNYTFNAFHDVNIGLVVPAGTQLPSGYPTTLGTQTMQATYAYANNEFFGREVYNISLMGDIQTMTAQIVCKDNIVYLLAEDNGAVNKIKDDGSYEDLQNSSGIPLDITDNRLYMPSTTALANAYFNLSNDGATLTVKLSGQEAEEFIEDINKNQQDFQFSDIVYVVHFDESGNLIKVNYLFQIYLEYMPGMSFSYDYDCTVTITNVNSTVVNAPADANTYIQSEFI